MTTLSKTPSTRSGLSRAAFASLAFAFVATFGFVPAAKATDATTAQPKTEKTMSIPLSPTYEKVKDSDKGPNLLHLKNTSNKEIKASAKILLAVAFHAEAKAKMLPEEKIAAGKTWTISGLAAGDKVIVTSAGFPPLELTVP